MGEYHINKTPKGNFNFYLLSSNKEKLLTSSQVYSTKSTCKVGLRSTIDNSIKCLERIQDNTKKDVEEVKCPRWEVYKDKADLFRFRLIASNGECIAITEQGYTTKQNCLKGIQSCAKHASEYTIVEDC